MFMNSGAVDRLIRLVGEPLEIYTADRGTLLYRSVPAEITMIDVSNFKLTKAGLRPMLDLLANIPSDINVSRGFQVKKSDSWYQVNHIEDVRDNAGLLISRRVSLVLLSPAASAGNLDLTS